VAVDGPGEPFPADRRDLAQADGRVFGPEFDDRPPDPDREPTPVLGRLGLRGEQAPRAALAEGGGLAPQGALGHPGLAGTSLGRAAEQDDRPQQPVGFLFGRGDERARLLPIVGGPTPASDPSGHGASSNVARGRLGRRARTAVLTARASRRQRLAGHRSSPPIART
jgi:hypothetical protein